MSTPSDPYEAQLREQLRTTTPGPYAGLDPTAVIGAGERVVRRRRLGAALVAAVVVAAVAVGVSALTGGRPVSAPVPAAPSSAQRTAHLTVAQNGGGSPRGYTVTLSPETTDKSGLHVTWTQDGVDGSVGSSVSDTGRRATWGFGDGSPFALGLVPDEAARSVTMATDGEFGGNTMALEPVVGTGWSAFVLAYDKPLTGTDPVPSMLWFDHLGRPVDQDGNVGSVTTIGGRQVWLTHDGSVLGMVDGGRTASTPLPGTRDFGGMSAFLRTALSTDGRAWTMALELHPEAATATLVLRGGRRVPVKPVRLGSWSVGVTPVLAGTTPPMLLRVEWATASGVQHDDAAVHEFSATSGG